MRRTALCLAACLAPVSASSQDAPAPAPQTRYTELVGGGCRFVSEDRQTRDDAVKRCPGHGGIEVETLASHTRVFLSFRFSRTQRADNVVAAWSLGKTVEWRGIKANKGFEPYAAIVRVLMKDPEALTRRADGEVLAVMRVDPREAEACAVALVDARANKAPNKLARDTADRLAPTFLCDSERPSVAGAATRWTNTLLKRE